MDYILISNEEKSLWEVGEECLDRSEEALDAALADMNELEGQEFTRDSLEAYLVLAERLGNNISKALEEADIVNRICKELISGGRIPRQKDRFDAMLSRIGFILKEVEAVSHRNNVYKRQLLPKVLNPEEMKGFEELVSQDREMVFSKVIDQQTSR